MNILKRSSTLHALTGPPVNPKSLPKSALYYHPRTRRDFHSMVVVVVLMYTEEKGRTEQKRVLPVRHFSQSDENLFYVRSMIKWAIVVGDV